MVTLHVKTTGQLEKKIELLKSQNQVLNHKLDGIINTLLKAHHERPSHTSPTPPSQLPPFLLPGDQPQPRKQPPPPPTIRLQPLIDTDVGSMSIIDEDSLPCSLPNNSNHHHPQSSNSQIQQAEKEPAHFDWMRDEFKRCFELPTERYKRRQIYSFDGVLLAHGYNKVVPTWQGLYFELKGEDIAFENLDRSFNTARGVTTWSTKGVEIFKLHREDLRTTPRPHRFAVVPSGSLTKPCNLRIVGKFYCHVYQTKVQLGERFFKTLNSKTMAKSLKQRYGIHYLPRPRDLPTEFQQKLGDRQQQANSEPTKQQNQSDWQNVNVNPNSSQRFTSQNDHPNQSQKNNAWYHNKLNWSQPNYETGKKYAGQEFNIKPNHTFPLSYNPPPFPFGLQATNLPWQYQQPYQQFHVSPYQNPENLRYPPGLQPQPNFPRPGPYRDRKPSPSFQHTQPQNHSSSYPVHNPVNQQSQQAMQYYQQPFGRAPPPPGVNYYK